MKISRTARAVMTATTLAAGLAHGQATAATGPAAGGPAAGGPATQPTTWPGDAATWVSDNGNGTYTNPLFYEEFSDPDVIRVGDDYYLAGTTNHAVPGLPILHSKDLVNWTLASYVVDRLEFGPRFSLIDGDVYGGGIWAPCLRYHDGTFYVFSNINGVGTQVYRSKSPNGPWTHNPLKTTLYDLGVLFDDDGKIWAFHGTEPIYLTQLNAEVTDVVPGTKRLLIPSKSGMGEGLHAYKIKGQYYLLSAIPGAHTNLVCARADTLAGPWTIEPLTDLESLGVPTDDALKVNGQGKAQTFERVKRDPNLAGGLTIHQGGIVDTPGGQWWSILMQDHGTLGRVSTLVPVTWDAGWPKVGLPGNLGKAPATWIKPETGASETGASETGASETGASETGASDTNTAAGPNDTTAAATGPIKTADAGTGPAPRALFERNDDFNSGKLKPIWQWNHNPDDAKWSVTGGKLRLTALRADDFYHARNTLTQRAVGPESTVTVELSAAHLAANDTAGLALLNWPDAWVGVTHAAGKLTLRQVNHFSGKTTDRPLQGPRVWLRAHCDYDTAVAEFSYSTDGKRFEQIGGAYNMLFQLRTFQGVRYGLFNYSTAGPAGYAEFDNFTVDEPSTNASKRPIPLGRMITLTPRAGDYALAVRDGRLVSIEAPGDAASGDAASGDAAGPKAAQAGDDAADAGAAARFRVVDRKQGRIALQAVDGRYVSVGAAGESVTLKAGDPGDAQTFQWIDLQRGDLLLMSLATNRYLHAAPNHPGPLDAATPAPRPDRRGGAAFGWDVVGE